MFDSYLIRFSNQLIKTQYFCKIIQRNYGNLQYKVFSVPQFCTVNINCPFSINVEPIDIFQAQEKVVVNINSVKQCKLPDIQYAQNRDSVSVSVCPYNNNENCTLHINTSVKANLNICGGDGNINIGSFYGKFINVISNNGHVNLLKSQCEKISLITNNGNITCKDVIQANDITLQTKNSGKITTDRLQGLNLKVSIKSGHINIGSSYCAISIFEADSGELTLQNLHKNVTININKEGLLNIVGFDGELYVSIKKGLADIQLANLVKDSEIIIEDSSSLILRLSDNCQKQNLINILGESFVVSDRLKMRCKQNNESCTLSPQDKDALVKLLIRSKNSHVLVDSTSWSELFEASIKKGL